MISTRENYYDILGIQKTATLDEIKKAFRKQIMLHHPDKCKGDEDAAKTKTQSIVKAHRILSNSRLKEQYDLTEESDKDELNAETSAFPESKAVQDFYSTMKPRPKRDPDAKAEPDFSLTVFTRTYQTLCFHRETEAIKEYLDNNIINLEATIVSGYSIIQICQYHYEDTYHLITRFDSEWLLQMNTGQFSHLPWLGQFLNTLPIEHWELFLNHLGRNWLESTLDTNTLRSLITHFTGFGDGSHLKDSFKYQIAQCHTLFKYLGQEHLRKKCYPSCLAEIMKSAFLFGNNCNCDSLILSFLNSEDNGIQKIIKNGNQIGCILRHLAEYEYTKSSRLFNSQITTSTLSENTQEKWEFFLKYLEKDWREKFLENPVEFNAFLKGLCPDQSNSERRISYFLKNYLHKDKFSSFEDLMAVLKPSVEAIPEEKETNSLNKSASLQFINAFSDEQINNMLLKNSPKDFDTLLTTLDAYKQEPFYEALLLAALRAHHFERASNPEAYTSQWGSTFGYSREQVLKAADELTRSILTRTDIQSVPGIYSGNVGKIYQRYMESLNPEKAKSDSMLKYLGLTYK